MTRPDQTENAMTKKTEVKIVKRVIACEVSLVAMFFKVESSANGMTNMATLVAVTFALLVIGIQIITRNVF